MCGYVNPSARPPDAPCNYGASMKSIYAYSPESDITISAPGVPSGLEP